MKPLAPSAPKKASGFAIGMCAAGSLVALYLAVGVLLTLDVRVYHTGWINTLPESARVGLVRAYTPFLRTLRLAGVLPPVVSAVQRRMAEIRLVQGISVQAAADGCTGALGDPEANVGAAK